MSITFNSSLIDQHITIDQLGKAYQCENFKITVNKKGGCIISDIHNEEISLHAELCVLIGAFYDSFRFITEDVFALFNRDSYDKEMTENKNIYLEKGIINFIYKDTEYALDLNKLVINSDVFCIATQAELDCEVQANV